MGILLQRLIERRSFVNVYLVDTQEPLQGLLCGIDDGFVMLADKDEIGARLTLIDRDSVWCITEQPATVTQ